MTLHVFSSFFFYFVSNLGRLCFCDFVALHVLLLGRENVAIVNSSAVPCWMTNTFRCGPRLRVGSVPVRVNSCWLVLQSRCTVLPVSVVCLLILLLYYILVDFLCLLKLSLKIIIWFAFQFPNILSYVSVRNCSPNFLNLRLLFFRCFSNGKSTDCKKNTRLTQISLPYRFCFVHLICFIFH